MFQTASGADALSPVAHLQMVAAVQPFLSGGMSKTVPLPSDAGVEETANIFVDGWRMSLKSIAVYRDGSKPQQPLTADED